MTNSEIRVLLEEFLASGVETEILEFKEAKKDFDIRAIGKYFSALSNEANLRNKPCGWLVFGVNNQCQIVGSQYRSERKDLDNLKKEIADKTTNRITFKDIHEAFTDKGRVILFQIPAAPRGIPIAFEGHYYGRDNSSLIALNIEKYERIRSQNITIDWSAEIIQNATIEDLDREAIKFARDNYKSKFPDKSLEVESWDDFTFLNKAKITIKNKITRTAIILLGKEESEHFISPAEAKIRWVLKDNNGDTIDYLIVSCPFILAVNKIYSMIRNPKYRYIQNGTLFPEEVDRYEPFTIREALNNCIAHQDYTLNGRINIIELQDQLVFTNLGGFIPGSVEKVVSEDAPEETYRNPFLATAMFNLRMVDTAGGGIRKMFNYQRIRLFPMPEYELTNKKVKVTITGKVTNLDYARILVQNPNLTLNDIMLLDKIQKKKSITRIEERVLRSKKLIEGRRPNYYFSLRVSQQLGQKAAYTKNKAFDKGYYLDLVQKAIKQHKELQRKDIDDLLWKKLPDWMTEAQKKNKITNLLTELRKKNQITRIRVDRKSKWVIQL